MNLNPIAEHPAPYFPTDEDIAKMAHVDPILVSYIDGTTETFVCVNHTAKKFGVSRECLRDYINKSKGKKGWYKQKNILLALSGYALIAFCYIILDELVPIFASADVVDGGLAYSTSKLSGPLSFSGVVLVVWMLIGYPWMSKKFGIIRTCIIGLIQTIPVTILFPLSSVSFLNTEIVFWLGMGLKSIAGSNAFTSCLVLVNLVAPKESLGEVNGLGQTLASGMRALGPFLGGVMWAGSIRLFTFLGADDNTVWGHQFLPFMLSTAIAGCCMFIYLKLHIPDIH
jgi:hypothetical protein